MTKLTHTGLDTTNAAIQAMIQESSDTLLEVRVRAYPDRDQSTAWQPMDGWGVRQVIKITRDGLYDGFEYRDAKPGGSILFMMGLWAGVGQREHLHVGDSLWITPKLFIDDVQVLPVPGTP